MKKTVILFFVILNSLSAISQDISGKWNGILNVQGTQLRLIFNISKTDKGYVSTMDSPDQGAKDIPVTKTSFHNSELVINITNLGIKYQGKINDAGDFKGVFKQAGLSIPLTLSTKHIEKEKVVRPQDPKKPYPYYSEDVKFENKKDKIELAGTLTLPKKNGNFPAVILISGSGPQNRNEELLNHKPFLILSDYLTRKGIAVLRFDDRGTAQSSGNFYNATTFDFVSDVEYAIKYLQSRKEIDKSKIGLIGHSEGGIIAPIIASKNHNIDFIVLLAGSMLRGDKQLLLQKSKIETQLGISQTKIDAEQNIFKKAYKMIVDKKLSDKELQDSLMNYFKLKYPENYANKLVKQLTHPWMITFLRTEPKNYLEKVSCPILALNGSKDLQVSAKENLQVIKTTFKQSKNITTKELENLNHLFQECNTGLPNEYGTISQTMSPIALSEIASWILKQVK